MNLYLIIYIRNLVDNNSFFLSKTFKIKYKERRVSTMLEKIEKKVLKTLKLVAFVCANSMSYCTFYQPKLPKDEEL